jgi:hypothetical protein
MLRRDLAGSIAAGPAEYALFDAFVRIRRTPREEGPPQQRAIFFGAESTN